MSRLPTLAVTVAVGLAPFLPGQHPAVASGVHTAAHPVAVAGRRPAVVERRVIGHSVMGRPIVAWRLGQRGRGIRTVLVMATMHGNERQVKQIPTALRDGRRIRGVNMWVIPTMNPDGYARDTRRNAHGVDLNRNFPYRWAHLTGNYASGPRPASEPETRAMIRFLKAVHPFRIVSFHQPLDAVDTATTNVRFSRRLARALNLPRHTVTCGGGCHGTMTGWYNRHFHGTAITAEYGVHPSRHRMRVAAPRQLLRLFGAHR
jgi:predicted deacylase